jgi:myo-inositol-1(or 4)-monophosphatase
VRWGNEWDIAAAALIAQEAGATVTNVFGHPLRYNSTRGEAFGVLATVPGIHASAVDRLASRASAGVVR